MTAVCLGEVDFPSSDRTQNGPSYTRVFRVRCDSTADGPTTAEHAFGVPNMGDWYNFGNDGTAFFCQMVKRKAKPSGILGAGKGVVYDVDCDYETPQNQTQENQVNDPTLELPEKKTSWTTTEKPMAGWEYPVGFLNPFLSAAGERIEHPPTRKVPIKTMSITRNYDIDFDEDPMSQLYCGKTNSDTFWGWPAQTVLLTTIESVVNTQKTADGDDFPYQRITFNFEFSTETYSDPALIGFYAEILNCGSFYLSDTGDKKAFLTKEGHKFIGLLTESGQALNGDGGPTPIAPNYLPPVAKYKSIAFAPLGLPQTNAQVKQINRTIV